MTELFDSYEMDLKQCLYRLTEILQRPEKHNLNNNPHEFDEAQKLLKQLEVESMNHVNDDFIRKKVDSFNDWDRFKCIRMSSIRSGSS
mmetsp:Transcript_44033/g.42612  ORF Transcript_44033/g.42612 Transcript_44033/m.42612 type:complete len:88 (+) Transcript_44033:3-266(+)